MEKTVLSKRELIFLEILKASINEEEIIPISTEEEAALGYDAKTADVLPLVYPLTEKFQNSNWRGIALKEAQKSTEEYYRRFMLARNIMFVLEGGGIEACLLKGADLAEFYPVPEYRTSSDVDILLKDALKLDESVRLLCKNGYTKKDEVCSPHHVVLESSAGDIAELHSLLMRPFDNERVNRKIAKIFSKENMIFPKKNIMGCDINTLPESEKAFYMLIHMLEHYLTTGFGVRLLCDWTLFWQDEGSLKYTAEYKNYIAECGMKTFSDMITFICVKYLGLDINKALLFTDENLWEDSSFEEKSLLLLKDILASGRFGEENAASLVSSTSSSLWGLFKEFHHQTKVNYPRASKCFVVWPILWVLSFFSFVVNNKKKRGVSTALVIRTAKRRAKLTEAMNLWKK